MASFLAVEKLRAGEWWEATLRPLRRMGAATGSRPEAPAAAAQAPSPAGEARVAGGDSGRAPAAARGGKHRAMSVEEMRSRRCAPWQIIEPVLCEVIEEPIKRLA